MNICASTFKSANCQLYMYKLAHLFDASNIYSLEYTLPFA